MMGELTTDELKAAFRYETKNELFSNPLNINIDIKNNHTPHTHEAQCVTN